MYDLTAFQRDILYILANLEKPYGLAIKNELETYYEGSINPGRMYQSLDSLVDKGLVNKGRHDGRTNYYTLTHRGRRELEDRLAWEAHRLDVDSVTDDEAATA